MKKIFYILIPLIVVAALVVRLRMNKETTEKKVFHFDQEKPVQVFSEVVRRQPLQGSQTFTGTFEAGRETKLAAELPGKITRIYVEEGKRVSRGNPIIGLDDSMLRLQLEAVEIQIEGLQSDQKRFSILTDSGAINGLQLEKNELALRSAIVQRKTLQEKISKSTIRAPFSGVVTQQLTEVGAFANPGMPLVQLSELGTLTFRVSVSEHQLPLFVEGKTYLISSEAYPDEKLEGKITQVGSRSGPGNTFPVEFRVSNTKDQKIKAGMFGEVVLPEQEAENVLFIPSSSIFGSSASPQVYVIRDSVAELRNLTVRRGLGENLVVESGIEEGEEVVTAGFISLYDGARVTAIQKTEQ